MIYLIWDLITYMAQLPCFFNLRLCISTSGNTQALFFWTIPTFLYLRLEDFYNSDLHLFNLLSLSIMSITSNSTFENFHRFLSQLTIFFRSYYPPSPMPGWSRGSTKRKPCRRTLLSVTVKGGNKQQVWCDSKSDSTLQGKFRRNKVKEAQRRACQSIKEWFLWRCPLVKHLKRVENLSVWLAGEEYPGKEREQLEYGEGGRSGAAKVEHWCQVLGRVVFVSVGICLALNSNTTLSSK